jgi:hypothetical protein
MLLEGVTGRAGGGITAVLVTPVVAGTLRSTASAGPQKKSERALPHPRKHSCCT